MKMRLKLDATKALLHDGVVERLASCADIVESLVVCGNVGLRRPAHRECDILSRRGDEETRRLGRFPSSRRRLGP
jgi:hypothetical protein